MKKKKNTQGTLSVSHLSVGVEGKAILRDITLDFPAGTVCAIMGPNGSGKSTLAYALMGHPTYQVKSKKSKVKINGKNILALPTDERAKAGLFLAIQSPIA